MTEEDRKEVEGKLAILQQLQAEAEAVQRKIVELEILNTEFRKTIDTLEYFKDVDGEVETLMNLGGGVFAYATVKNPKRFLVDVGSSVVIEKDVGDAIEFLKKKVERTEEEINKLTSVVQQIASQAAKIQNELARMVKREGSE